MADIHIQRDHALGLAKARKTAERWAEEVEEKFGLSCTIVEGDDHDVVEFERPGVRGELRVEAATFELKARLGLLAGAFRQRIESEIERNLDTVLAKAGGRRKRAPGS